MNTSGNVVQDKSFQFAVRIVRLSQYLTEKKRAYVLSKQLLRSGTSIGANIREAINAESRADFIHKRSISQKEADETLYWLDLLRQADYLTQPEYESIHIDAGELIKLLRSIIITTKETAIRLKNNS
jgi:four helix bundle protein